MTDMFMGVIFIQTYIIGLLGLAETNASNKTNHTLMKVIVFVFSR